MTTTEDRLREALKWAEWSDTSPERDCYDNSPLPYDRTNPRCPFCSQHKTDGHTDDCMIGQALAEDPAPVSAGEAKCLVNYCRRPPAYKIVEWSNNEHLVCEQHRYMCSRGAFTVVRLTPPPPASAPPGQGIPETLSVVPNIPFHDQTVQQLEAELAYWQAKADGATGWGAGVGFAQGQADAARKHLASRLVADPSRADAAPEGEAPHVPD